ncbi:MAG: hypothetical protein KDA85_14800, partial [Planctomycetaceae bacterium]|nr:hypothetical protein [Planctomycetaceae bacterium]
DWFSTWTLFGPSDLQISGDGIAWSVLSRDYKYEGILRPLSPDGVVVRFSTDEPSYVPPDDLRPGEYDLYFSVADAASGDALIQLDPVRFTVAPPSTQPPVISDWQVYEALIGGPFWSLSVAPGGDEGPDSNIADLKQSPEFDVRLTDRSTGQFVQQMLSRDEWEYNRVYLREGNPLLESEGPLEIQIRYRGYGEGWGSHIWHPPSAWSSPVALQRFGTPTTLTSEPTSYSPTDLWLSWPSAPTIIDDHVYRRPQYEIWISDAVRKATVIHQTGLYSCFYWTADSLPAGLYYAWVRPTYGNGPTGAWSNVHPFEINAPPVQIVGGTRATADATPVIRWTPVDDAASYEVLIQEDGQAVSAYQRAGLTGTQHRLDEPLPRGNYRVWVRATLSSGAHSLLDDGESLIVGPATVVTSKGGLVTWNAVSDATEYELWVDRVDDNGRTIAPRILNKRVYGLTATLDLGAGKYRVWIRAIRSESGQRYLSAWSKPATVVTDS